jgi:hypothetical protein
VLNETQQRFVFELAGLRLEDEWLTFYIRPADGLGLPDIMKWLKQTFAARYNLLMGRIGHIWGDRYWSLILEGEPPEGGEEVEGESSIMTRITRVGVRPRHGKIPHKTDFSLIFSHFPTAPPS